MIFVTALFHPRPAKRDVVLNVLRETIPQVHEEPGCRLYAAYMSEDDDSVALFEAWESEEHLERHSEGEAVRSQRSQLRDALLQPIDVRRYLALPIGDPERGALEFSP